MDKHDKKEIGEVRKVIKEERADQIKDIGARWKDELEDLKQNNEIASVYFEHSGLETFSVGFISVVENKDFIINHIHPTGRYDGYITREIEDIILVERHTKYAKKIETLAFIQGEEHDTIEVMSNSSFLSVLHYASRNKKIVSIELMDEEVFQPVGFVKFIKEGVIKIANINEYGEEDGESTIILNDITRIQCDCEDEQILKKLWESDKLNIKKL